MHNKYGQKRPQSHLFIYLFLLLMLFVNIIISYYYMAVSHEDWELPNSRIRLTEIDIDRGLDFPI